MRKFLIFLLFISSTFNSAKAEQLVLSDIIQETRNRILMQEAKEKAEFSLMHNPAKNENEFEQNSQTQDENKKTK